MLLLNQRGKIFLTLIINIDSHNSMYILTPTNTII